MSARSSSAGPDADAPAEPPASTRVLPLAPASSSASAFSIAASNPVWDATASMGNGASACATCASAARTPILRTTINSWARAAATRPRCESRTLMRLSAFAPVSVRRPSSWTKRLILTPPLSSGERRAANSRSRPSPGRSRNSAPRPTMWSALSSRGRRIGASPNACSHASLAASDSMGDQTTCRAPVCAAIPAIAAASAGCPPVPSGGRPSGRPFSAATRRRGSGRPSRTRRALRCLASPRSGRGPCRDRRGP